MVRRGRFRPVRVCETRRQEQEQDTKGKEKVGKVAGGLRALVAARRKRNCRHGQFITLSADFGGLKLLSNLPSKIHSILILIPKSWAHLPAAAGAAVHRFHFSFSFCSPCFKQEDHPVPFVYYLHYLEQFVNTALIYVHRITTLVLLLVCLQAAAIRSIGISRFVCFICVIIRSAIPP